MKYYDIDEKKALKELESSSKGLTQEDALKRLEKNGKNKLTEAKKESKIVKFLKEFNDLMIIILCLAAGLSFVLSIINNESFIDSIIILAIVFINAILGFIQELKADKAIDELNKMQVTNIKVKRNDEVVVINTEDLVVGDILVLEAGDQVPADARLIWEASLKVDEASLTGESVAVTKSIKKITKKEVPISERTNMIYSGTSVVYGKCLAVVTATGMDTEIGLIADQLSKEETETTPLQKKINNISKILSIIIMIIIAIMFVIGLVKGMEFTEVLLLSISLAVAAIPEGLPAVITIILSLGMSSLAKKKAIVRKMSSVETLGCTEIICSDKTGTITQNKMTVQEIFYDKNIYGEHSFKDNNILTKIMMLNNDIEVSKDNYIGDPTELALYNYCEEIDINVLEERKKYPRIAELPFDSDRKMMSTIHYINDEYLLLTKGSFDSILAHSNYFLVNGKKKKLTKSDKEYLKQVEEEESGKAYRILAFAYKKLPVNFEVKAEMEDDLIFVGMVGMIDPPREDVVEAIMQCKNAHIKPIMITGDSLATAKAIAKEIGILENDDEAITGTELDKFSEEELKEVVKKYTVYARVSPMNKLAIVNAWKENNKVVAMTGDGVNDAPALKTSHIGVGMGITGTEVSKGASDIILSDDSFATIVSAVKEGRRIFDNIRNVLVYLLTGNITEIIVIFVGMLFGLEVFIPIQLLYINLITDSIPAIALAFEKESANIMSRDVRKKDSSFFTPFLLAKIISSSILKSIIILTTYFIGLKAFGIEIASTMAFLTLILAEMIFAFSCRNLKSMVMEDNVFGNSYLNKSTLGLAVIQLLVFITPLKNLFNIVPLNFAHLAMCFGLVIIMFMLDEFSKKLISKIFKD